MKNNVSDNFNEGKKARSCLDGEYSNSWEVKLNWFELPAPEEWETQKLSQHFQGYDWRWGTMNLWLLVYLGSNSFLLDS